MNFAFESDYLKQITNDYFFLEAVKFQNFQVLKPFYFVHILGFNFDHNCCFIS